LLTSGLRWVVLALFFRFLRGSNCSIHSIKCNLTVLNWNYCAEFVFSTIDFLEKDACCLYAHLLKFGLTMRIGTGATPSKNEAFFSNFFFFNDSRRSELS
jgi:hypothetical protein